jgi:hypothetical protein
MKANERTGKVIYDHGPMGWVLFMAWVGAAIYFYQQDPGFWGFILALLKAAVWPAYVLYHVLGILGA